MEAICKWTQGQNRDYNLEKRFCCKDTEKLFSGMLTPKSFIAIDVDSFKKWNHFSEILGYINTEEGA